MSCMPHNRSAGCGRGVTTAGGLTTLVVTKLRDRIRTNSVNPTIQSKGVQNESTQNRVTN